MKIRAYQKEDKNKLGNILKLNIPKYFAEEEYDDLIVYLDNHIEYYYVVENDDQIVGSGGFNTTDRSSVMRVSWDFFHPESQGKGYGSVLLEFRIKEIKKINGITTIEVRTSQMAYIFYQKSGFEIIEIKKDFWAKGFDLFLMCKTLY